MVNSFTPAARRGVNLHLSHDAMPIIRLEKARPGLMIEGEHAEDVIVNQEKIPDMFLFLFAICKPSYNT